MKAIGRHILEIVRYLVSQSLIKYVYYPIALSDLLHSSETAESTEVSKAGYKERTNEKRISNMDNDL